MELINFRQFYGHNRIDFADGRHGRNVTVFHGYNGAGKTALLNAFVWCLYGETTPDLEEPGKLENEKAISEAPAGSDLEVKVKLVFEEHSKKYVAQRWRKSTRTGEARSVKLRESELSLMCLDHDGQLVQTDHTQELQQLRLERILPKELYPFFFFNGERVERLARKEAYTSVEHGVKTLLDIEIYERGARHLGKDVSSMLSEELKKMGSNEIQELIQRETSISEDQEETLKEIDEMKANLEAIHDEISQLEHKQAQIANLAELTRKREDLRDKRTLVLDQVQRVESNLAHAVSKDGYLAFATRAFDATSELVEDARERGELPARIKPRFVDDLLEGGRCICGRPLIDGEAPHQHLVEWKKETGVAYLEEAIAHTAADVDNMSKRREDYFESIRRTMEGLEEAQSQLKRIEKDLALIDEQVDEDSQEHEQAARIADQLKQLNRDSVIVQSKIEDRKEHFEGLKKQMAEVKKLIKEQKQQDRNARLIQHQKDVVERLASVLRQVAEIKKDDVRQSLDTQIKDIWRDAAIKDYTASINKQYKLILTKRVNGVEQPVTGASTGEKQVLALSFVASLVKKLNDNYKEASERPQAMAGLPSGSQHPLIMDSPFGSLEDDYREKVARWLPNLANQVVIMVSKTQWRNEVERTVESRIGKQYILELHTSKENAGRNITLRGQPHPYVVQDNDPAEHTRIVPVEREM